MTNNIIGTICALRIGAKMGCQDQCQNLIHQSGDTPLNFQVTNCDGTPFDISAATEIWAMFPTLVNPPVILKLSLSQLSITNGGAGMFTGIMSVANALLLTPGLIDVEIRVTIAAEITVTDLIGQLTVIPSKFPGF